MLPRFRQIPLLSVLIAGSLWAVDAPKRYNVLFIAADDLRTDLGCYDSQEAVTPNLDALAKQGVQFNRAYCQQAVCNPSRASALTGLRPDTVKVWNLRTHFREALPEVVTLPQLFKNNGYTAIDIGKIYHNESGAQPPVPFADPLSWSQPPAHAVGAHWEDNPLGPSAKQGPTQCLDVPDNAYWDGQIADEAIATLGNLKKQDRPFFLAVGFWKPHLPFNAPKKYWDLYDRSKLSAPANPLPPKGAPEIAGHDSDELRKYGGMPAKGPLAPAQVMELRHGYLASVSFLDAQVGRVVAALKREGLADNTIIVFWSDHGYHLGEHDLWAKTSNYELDARVPLLIVAPGQTHGAKTDALVELLDLYPTLAEFCSLTPPSNLEGQSLLPLLKNPAGPGKEFAVTQHPHPRVKPTAMGYALRTARYRYVEWRDLKDDHVVARELYDQRKDPAETVNLADDPAFKPDLATLTAQLAKARPPRRS